MSELTVETNCLGFEIHDGDRLVTLYRATEELAREESPKPCFHPIYTPGGNLGAMSSDIISILYDQPFDLPRQSIADAIYPVLRDQGVTAALQQYRELKKDKADDFLFRPGELNEGGEGVTVATLAPAAGA